MLPDSPHSQAVAVPSECTHHSIPGWLLARRCGAEPSSGKLRTTPLPGCVGDAPGLPPTASTLPPSASTESSHALSSA